MTTEKLLEKLSKLQREANEPTFVNIFGLEVGQELYRRQYFNVPNLLRFYSGLGEGQKQAFVQYLEGGENDNN